MNGIKDFFNHYKIDDVINIEKMSGGLVHESYKVTCKNNCYFLKIINSNRDINNINEKEIITNYLNDCGINTCHAIQINNNYVNNYNGELYMLINYIDGLMLEGEDISSDNIIAMAKAVSNMHSLNYDNLEISKEKTFYKLEYDFTEYLKSESLNNMPFKNELIEKSSFLNKLTEICKNAYNNSYKKVGICHKDLKPSNVLWKNNLPYLIDWETGGVWNIYREMISVAIDWSGFLDFKFDIDKYNLFLKEYTKKISITAAASDIVYANLVGRICWLKVNLDESLSNKTEKSINEVNKMLKEIDYYLSLKDIFINELEKYIK